VSTDVIVSQRTKVDKESHTLTKTIPSIITMSSQEDPIPLVTVSMTIMIVVHSTKISALYPHIVILSLAKRLESLLFVLIYTFFGVWS
jgi:hypothetical protein